ncbi:unnamed protein product [Lampetra fluviatilis]
MRVCVLSTLADKRYPRCREDAAPERCPIRRSTGNPQGTLSPENADYLCPDPRELTLYIPAPILPFIRRFPWRLLDMTSDSVLSRIKSNSRLADTSGVRNGPLCVCARGRLGKRVPLGSWRQQEQPAALERRGEANWRLGLSGGPPAREDALHVSCPSLRRVSKIRALYRGKSNNEGPNKTPSFSTATESTTLSSGIDEPCGFNKAPVDVSIARATTDTFT